MPRRIIDSHIHLFDKAHLQQLAWMTKDSPLNQGHDLVRYDEEADTRSVNIEGVVFIESDRKVTNPINDPNGWNYVLDEYGYIDRILRGDLLPAERSDPLPSDLKIKAAIPWAPVPAGPKVLETFISKLKLAGSHNFDCIKGFRYLVQDKPKGVMLEENFVKGVQYLGQHGYIFELGIDMRSGGLWQLEEAIELVKAVPETIFVIGE